MGEISFPNQIKQTIRNKQRNHVCVSTLYCGFRYTGQSASYGNFHELCVTSYKFLEEYGGNLRACIETNASILNVYVSFPHYSILKICINPLFYLLKPLPL